MHDPRIGRFFALDPLRGVYPELTPYQFSSNNTVWLVEIEGLEGGISTGGSTPFMGSDNQHTTPGMVIEVKHIKSLDGEQLHVLLDVLGVIPIVGEVFDGVNGLIYAFEGDKTNAFISFASMVPLVGDAAKLSKYGKYAVKFGDNAKSIAKSTDDLLTGGKFFKTAKAARNYIHNVGKYGKYAADLYADGLIKSKAAAQQLMKVKPCGCFTEETKVLTSEGYENISEIELGDFVWAYDDSTRSYGLKKVTYLFAKEWNEIYEIVFGADTIRATYEHPFLIGGNWLEVKDLLVGDSLTHYDGTYSEISSIKVLHGEFQVYNLEVDDYHTYFVSDERVLVHNGACDFISVNVQQIRKFFSTEPFAQADKAIDAINKRIDAKDPTVWSDPIYTTTIDGKTYVLDGHNRLEALSKRNYSKKVNVVDLTEDKATELFKSKVEDIKSGGFETTIGE